MGRVPQVQTGTYLEIVPLVLQDDIVQHGGHTNADIREWNMDTIERTQKKDQISSAENDSSHCSDGEDTRTRQKKKRRSMRGQKNQKPAEKIARAVTKTVKFLSVKTKVKKLIKR